MSDIPGVPKGWTLERVPGPDTFKLPATDKYRENYDRIFGKKDLEPAPKGD